MHILQEKISGKEMSWKISTTKKQLFSIFLTIFVSLFWLSNSYAIEPEEVAVVANKRVAGSLDLAKYYMEKRDIPKENLIVLVALNKESIDRKEYDRWIKKPVAKKLKRLQKQHKKSGLLPISTIVTIYGVPLKIEELKENREKQIARDQVTSAAVDSELSLVQADSYELNSWIENPFYIGNYIGNTSYKPLYSKNEILLVSRLDAPNLEIVYKMIDDSLEVEQKGLQGVGYFDARWPRPAKNQEKSLQGYALYDFSVHLAAEKVKTKMAVVLDDRQELFGEGSSPETALYCGWYSMGRYIDSFSWVKGAIGYHIASTECVSLHKEGVTYWCPQMLAKGAAATIGPVDEPFVQGFPMPHFFFSALLEGMSLGEAYLISLPSISWQMVLVGDPLYEPFHKN